jgi:hypothetical protein
MTPLAFARAQRARVAPCYALPFAWMRAHGATPASDSAARRAWRKLGALEGSKIIAAQIGLIEREAEIGDIVLFAQAGEDAVLGLAMGDGRVVARSFSALFVGRPKILLSWRLP